MTSPRATPPPDMLYDEVPLEQRLSRAAERAEDLRIASDRYLPPEKSELTKWMATISEDVLFLLETLHTKGAEK